MQDRGQVRDRDHQSELSRTTRTSDDTFNGLRHDHSVKAGRKTGSESPNQARRNESQRAGRNAKGSESQAAGGWDKLFSFQFSA